jgi:hypothetical protein
LLSVAATAADDWAAWVVVASAVAVAAELTPSVAAEAEEPVSALPPALAPSEVAVR